MKDGICTGIGAVGGLIAAFFGGWDAALITLIMFMIIDYASGLIVAGVFHASKKTETGTLESRAGWKGLCRKGMTLLFVLIAYRLDLAIGVSYIRDAVIIGFIANELISIVENAGLMGLPLPSVIKNAIAILTKQAETKAKVTTTEDSEKETE
ncbi:MAG: phage holin family protein [Lachnospiraceae bacterium]|nr:phage holin family protein [Lachnospiraceae bacterium]